MRKALVIDDDAFSRAFFAQALPESQWRIFQADDGDQGLELARRERPDLIICDLMMPGRSGFDVCREIRQDPAAFGRPRIIATTASDFSVDHQNAINSGADELVVKPVRIEDLKAVIDRSGSQPEPRPASSSTTISQYAPIKDYFVRFWGVRGSIPVPGPSTLKYGGNTSCVEIRADGELIILDSGTGIRNLGLALADEFKGQPLRFTVLITHTHWDHIQGFPFFAAAYNPANSIRIMSFESANNDLLSTLSNQMESPYFPIQMEKMPGNLHVQEIKDLKFNIGKVEARAIFSNHPGVCAGYRFNTSRGSVAYMPDNELLGAHPNDPGARQFTCKADPVFIDFFRDCDVLIIDSQYGPDEYPKYIGWGHSCWEDSIRVAMSANVKRVFLHHHDPLHDDAFVARKAEHGQELARKAGSSLIVDCAAEGCLVPLDRRSA